MKKSGIGSVASTCGDKYRAMDWLNGESTHRNGVASCAIPCMAPALPARLSTNMPIVIRDGKACGLMITSGCMPDSVNGMSTAGHFWEQTPFWPCLEENLSPITGDRGTLSLKWILVHSVVLVSLPVKLSWTHCQLTSQAYNPCRRAKFLTD